MKKELERLMPPDMKAKGQANDVIILQVIYNSQHYPGLHFADIVSFMDKIRYIYFFHYWKFFQTHCKRYNVVLAEEIKF